MRLLQEFAPSPARGSPVLRKAGSKGFGESGIKQKLATLSIRVVMISGFSNGGGGRMRLPRDIMVSLEEADLSQVSVMHHGFFIF